MANSDFNVLDMLDEVENETSEIFTKPAPAVVEKPPVEMPAEKPVEEPVQTLGAVYEIKDVEFNKDTELKNNAEEAWKENGKDAIQDLEWKEHMIEKAKTRNNIKSLRIPEGMLYAEFLMAASNTNEEEAQKDLDVLIKRVREEYPECIAEFIDPSIESFDPMAKVEENEESSVVVDDESLKIIIDKTNVPELQWSDEELEKIRKSRSIELNIKDKGDIEFGTVKNLKGNAIDKALEQYQRKTNDIVRALPASKYRATFTGLTYPEVLDLQVSVEMSSFDAEMKKWTIAFNHIKNQSIGPWKEYIEYSDPETGNNVQLPIGSDLPPGVSEKDAYRISQFDDFMRHTSYLDLNYIIWCVLCATAMESEIINIQCKNPLPNGSTCNNTYDWVYKPAELLSLDSIPEEVANDMKAVIEAADREEALRVYNESFVADNGNYIKLPSSGFYLFYGHVSAYKFMDEIFGSLDSINRQSKEDNPDPSLVSKLASYTACQAVKSIIIKNEDGTYGRIDGVNDLVKVLESLDEMDWKIIMEISDLVIKPYTNRNFRYSIRGLYCNKCHTRSSIPINDMSRLLFIVAQSLQSVQVKLTKQ